MRVAALVLFIAGCVSGETNVQPPVGPPIAVVEPQYLIIRPLAQDGSPSATLMDLSHFDMRTAEVVTPETVPPRPVYAIQLVTTPAGDEILGRWTAANVGKQIEILLDGKRIASPIIASRITGLIVLDGGFTKDQAGAIVARMRRGGKA
ncbi:MAG: SecDF P1 head subdomain-containing protein [Thermoanaerobaculia bacterium]